MFSGPVGCEKNTAKEEVLAAVNLFCCLWQAAVVAKVTVPPTVCTNYAALFICSGSLQMLCCDSCVTHNIVAGGKRLLFYASVLVAAVFVLRAFPLFLYFCLFKRWQRFHFAVTSVVCIIISLRTVVVE